jgi:hypothetical protein
VQACGLLSWWEDEGVGLVGGWGFSTPVKYAHVYLTKSAPLQLGIGAMVTMVNILTASSYDFHW